MIEVNIEEKCQRKTQLGLRLKHVRMVLIQVFFLIHFDIQFAFFQRKGLKKGENYVFLNL